MSKTVNQMAAEMLNGCGVTWPRLQDMASDAIAMCEPKAKEAMSGRLKELQAGISDELIDLALDIARLTAKYIDERSPRPEPGMPPSGLGRAQN